MARWGTLQKPKTPQVLWKAVGWRGSLDCRANTKSTPSDRKFVTYSAELLQSNGVAEAFHILPSHLYIPVLDDVINPGESVSAVRNMRANKVACWNEQNTAGHAQMAVR